ncbi:glycerophosphodiester phosphodiesterase family protein [Paremcibacter congregatus]|uniref:glycerophosphodiester phosphodiesterase family protein n=1 Tax=Paremcibacter congregatus TaxID=2043170 RepID=UPI003A8FA55C
MNKKWLTDPSYAPLAFAHRGLHGPVTGHVENSLSAFLAANDANVGIELDVLLSKDNQAMVIHEMNLHRLTGLDADIGDFTAEELMQINLSGVQDVILPLSHVLAAIEPKFPLLVEIKGDQLKPQVIAAASHQALKDYKGPVAIMSFYPDIITWFKDHAPDIARGLVATSRNDGDLPASYFSEDGQIKNAKNLDVDFIAYDIRTLPNKVSAYCREKSLPLFTWTVRTQAEQDRARQYTNGPIFEILPDD